MVKCFKAGSQTPESRAKRLRLRWNERGCEAVLMIWPTAVACIKSRKVVFLCCKKYQVYSKLQLSRIA